MSMRDPLLYSQVESVLAAEIADGSLRSGDQLPTEDKLIGRFEVSRIRKIITNNLRSEPISSLLERKYNVPLVEAEYKLEAVAATHDVSAALCEPHCSPMFLIGRTPYSTGGRPVDYERWYYQGDLIRFVTRMDWRSSR
jgi:DNA-binding GntR family transcriptional regulator